MGDVIRTTPLFERLKQEYPRARFFWLTDFPQVVPPTVDRILPFDPASLTWLRSLDFSMIINLDKDPQACALLEQLSADDKRGFGLQAGMPAPINQAADHKFRTGISDTYSQENTQHYLEEIFAIIDMDYRDEEYILPPSEENPLFGQKLGSMDMPIIGLNTGCGGRWKTRLWSIDNWRQLTELLTRAGYAVLFLGGPEEDEKNQYLADTTDGIYLGHFPFNQFITLVDHCALVVSAVTMAMHVAVGLKKPMVLLNNIFNRHEFHFFTDSTILEPPEPCECYYRPTCKKGETCLNDISPQKVVDAVIQLLPR